MKKITIIGLGYVGLPLEIDYKNIINENYVLYDVKSILPKKLITLRL